MQILNWITTFVAQFGLTILIAILITLEAVGFGVQLVELKKTGRQQGLSRPMFIYLCFMFLSFFLYGLFFIKDWLLAVNGLIFVECLIIVIEMKKDNPFSKIEKILILVCGCLALYSFFTPHKEILFFIILSGSSLALIDQAYKITKCALKRLRNDIRLVLILFHLANNGFWAIYAKNIQVIPLFIISIINSLLIFFVLVVWLINRHTLMKAFIVLPIKEESAIIDSTLTMTKSGGYK